jgi:predicted transcriptional regulator
MVKDYPQLNLRVPPETRAKLNALSTVRKQPRWRIVLDAIDHYFDLQQEATLDEP